MEENLGPCKNSSNPKSILKSLLNLFKLPNRSLSKPYPTEMILSTDLRPGLSPRKIAAKIIKRQSEAGIPVGPLPSGKISPDEIMERIRVEEIVNAITSEMVVDVAISPGASLTAVGFNAGGPIVVKGAMDGVSLGKGAAR
jgi:hypothetical protein